MRIALVQQDATSDREENIGRGLAAGERAACSCEAVGPSCTRIFWICRSSPEATPAAMENLPGESVAGTIRGMKILALERDVPGVTDGQCAPHLVSEAKRAWDLHQAGVIRELWFRADRDAAVLVLECDGVEEAQRVLATLPLVREGLIDFEIVPLRAYPGFGRLFAAGAWPAELGEGTPLW